jgi:hypothetical protein
VRAVKRKADGQLIPLSRTYATVRWDPDGIVAVGTELADHCATLLHNLRNPNRPLLTQHVVNTHLDPRYAPMLIRDLQEHATVMAESADDELNDPQYVAKPGSPGGALRLGIGIYLFEQPGDPDAPESGAEAPTERPPKRRPRRKGKSPGSARR